MNPSPSLPSERIESSRRVLVRNRTYDGTKKKWSTWSDLLYTTTLPLRPDVDGRCRNNDFIYNFSDGGQLCVYPNLLGVSQQQAVTEELMQCGHFRQYSIHCSQEPRTHFLLHDDATNDFDGIQPGYRYGCTRMKSRPLRTMVEVERLSKEMQSMRQQANETSSDEKSCFWNIGVNPVLYRDGRDKIGFHADDDQGEELILTTLVSSPVETTRRICIKSCHFKKEGNLDKDEEFEMLLIAGDAYSMDGEMQKHYVHGVPCSKNSVGRDADSAENKRIAIVFRRGRQQGYAKDSGKACASLQPRVRVPYLFGNCILGLREGSTYTREQLADLYAHRSSQKGVSGNQIEGCDSIIVSGLRSDCLGSDELFKLMYACNTQEGALTILRSKSNNKSIRVFRSSVLNSAYRAISKGNKGKATARYRFDGMYSVSSVKYLDDETRLEVDVENPLLHLSSRRPSARRYLFYLARVPLGSGPFGNRVRTVEFLQACVDWETMVPEAQQHYLRQIVAPWLDRKEMTESVAILHSMRANHAGVSPRSAEISKMAFQLGVKLLSRISSVHPFSSSGTWFIHDTLKRSADDLDRSSSIRGKPKYHEREIAEAILRMSQPHDTRAALNYVTNPGNSDICGTGEERNCIFSQNCLRSPPQQPSQELRTITLPSAFLVAAVRSFRPMEPTLWPRPSIMTPRKSQTRAKQIASMRSNEIIPQRPSKRKRKTQRTKSERMLAARRSNIIAIKTCPSLFPLRTRIPQAGSMVNEKVLPTSRRSVAGTSGKPMKPRLPRKTQTKVKQIPSARCNEISSHRPSKRARKIPSTKAELTSDPSSKAHFKAGRTVKEITVTVSRRTSAETSRAVEFLRLALRN